MHRPSGKCGERKWSLAREGLVPGTGTLLCLEDIEGSWEAMRRPEAAEQTVLSMMSGATQKTEGEFSSAMLKNSLRFQDARGRLNLYQGKELG